LKLGRLAVVSLPAASASSSSGNTDDRDKRSVEVIRLLAVIAEGQEQFLDLGPQGDSVGDQFVFSDNLFRNGKEVGISGVHCTTVRPEPDVSATQQCIATFHLPKGQITAQGPITFLAEPDGEPFQLATTGGTGRYRTAYGVLSVRGVTRSISRSNSTGRRGQPPLARTQRVDGRNRVGC
jgi:hypothetical protein